jgi:hypothetical protein
MYNAMANHEGAGSHGSTKLHMDMADAVNIMTFSAPKPDGSEGCAVWDLYRAEDADKIRKFLRDRFSIGAQHDPIHSQAYYLDANLRAELLKRTGVKSHRVYQKPGEAVFIPAGCAHQVMSPCVSSQPTADRARTVTGVQSRGLHQGRDGLCQPGEHRAVREADARVQGAEPVDAVEGGRAPAADHDVVRVALVLPAGEAVLRRRLATTKFRFLDSPNAIVRTRGVGGRFGERCLHGLYIGFSSSLLLFAVGCMYSLL